MSTERIFNIFVYFDNGIACEYGVRHHSITGSDEAKTAHLLSRIDSDHSIARRFALSRTFTAPEWLSAQRHGSHLELFEKAFQIFRAPAAPIFCLTAIFDGVPKVDKQIDPAPYRGDKVTEQEGWGAVPDYLVTYTAGEMFRFNELINDDYFNAIRTLFNAKLYVSSSKLLMSCVDTLSFVEYGDIQGNFIKWVETYLDLSPQQISPEELWEFRNSVLHMTNLASRKVLAAKVSPIMPYIGAATHMPVSSAGMPKPFNLFGLVQTVGKGIEKWAETYNSDRDKLLTFIERYDTTISDARMTWISKQAAS